jgi:hypothetical protein
MADIPNVPGVPALTSYSDSPSALMAVDTLISVASSFAPLWGVFAEGMPVIIPATVFGSIGNEVGVLSVVASIIGFPNVVPVVASTLEFDYSAQSPISNYPQENGAFQSYNKVQTPYDVRLKIAAGGSSAVRQALFSTLDALRTSPSLVDVVTPEKVYRSCNCKHVDYRRTAARGVDLILAEVWFEEVRVKAATLFTTTNDPTVASQQSNGNVQSSAAPDDVVKQFNGVGGAPY